MTTITGNQTHGDSRVGSRFDTLVGLADAPPVATGLTSARTPQEGPRTIEELMLAAPSRPRASLTTVALVFLAIAIAQVGVLAISVVSLDPSAVRLILPFVVIAPAVLYTIVAAWDHRQLIASGHESAPRWEWSFVFPPLYLGLRSLGVTGSRRDRRAALVWAVAQFAVTVAFVVFAVTALVSTPAQPASVVSATQAAQVVPEIGDVTASVVEQQVIAGWTEAGDTGTASCAEPVAQDPGTPISCTGVVAGAPIEFTAVVGDRAAGEAPVIITRWSEGAAG